MEKRSFWDVTVPRVMSTFAVVIFVILWVGFALALLVNREWLGVLWNWVQALPTTVEIIVWLVFLPITTVLWIWQSTWSVIVRLLALTGMGVWTFAAVSSFYRAFRKS